MINKQVLIRALEQEIKTCQELEEKHNDGFFAAQIVANESLLKRIKNGEFDER